VARARAKCRFLTGNFEKAEQLIWELLRRARWTDLGWAKRTMGDTFQFSLPCLTAS
jgi:hypothetical protein